MQERVTCILEKGLYFTACILNHSKVCSVPLYLTVPPVSVLITITNKDLYLLPPHRVYDDSVKLLTIPRTLPYLTDKEFACSCLILTFITLKKPTIRSYFPLAESCSHSFDLILYTELNLRVCVHVCSFRVFGFPQTWHALCPETRRSFSKVQNYVKLFSDRVQVKIVSEAWKLSTIQEQRQDKSFCFAWKITGTVSTTLKICPVFESR